MLIFSKSLIYPVFLFYGFIKFLVMVSLIGIFFVFHGFLKFFSVPKKYTLKSISIFCRLGLWVLNVKVFHYPCIKMPSNRLIIANHLSYLDILVLFAYYPSLFITSKEIEETPVLGHLAKLADCFFVERRKSHRQSNTVLNEINEMKDELLRGFNLFLFPEGTSSNGQTVLPFKTSFFQTAIDCQKEILPLCLKYTSINDERFDSGNADIVCWYGEMTFTDHLFKLCLQQEIKVDLTELPIMQAQAFKDRFELGLFAHQVINSHYS